MFDSPSKPSTQEYRDNYDRIWGKPLNPPCPDFIGSPADPIFLGHTVILDPTQAQDEAQFVTSNGTAYKITNIGILIFAAVFFGSLPLMAVVTHNRQQPATNFAAAVPSSANLILYDVEGNRVAYCDREPVTARLRGCTVVAGETLDDVMNAWLRAYEDR